MVDVRLTAEQVSRLGRVMGMVRQGRMVVQSPGGSAVGPAPKSEAWFLLKAPDTAAEKKERLCADVLNQAFAAPEKIKPNAGLVLARAPDGVNDVSLKPGVIGYLTNGHVMGSPALPLPSVPAPKPLGYVGHLETEVCRMRREIERLTGELAALRADMVALAGDRDDAIWQSEIEARQVTRLRAWLSVMALTHPSALEALRGDAAPEVERWG